MKGYKIAALICGLLLLAGMIPCIPALQAWDGEKLLRVWPMEYREVFCYDFVHSYERQPVWEDYYILEDGRIALKELRYQALAYDNKERTYSKGYILENGIAYIRDIDKNYQEFWPEVVIRVAGIVPQRLVIEGEQYMLNSLAKAGTVLTLRAGRISVWQYLFLK